MTEEPDGYCPSCNEPLYHGIATVRNYGNGPVEISGYYCEVCDTPYIDGEDYINDYPEHEEKMTNTTETLNIIQHQNGIKLIEVQNSIAEQPSYVKAECDFTCNVDDRLVVVDANSALSIARVCDPTPARTLLDNLEQKYNWAVAVITTDQAQHNFRAERELHRAIVTAEAEARAKLILDELPAEVRQLAEKSE